MSFKIDPHLQLGYTTIKVQNLQAAKEFYSKLGLHIMSEEPQQIRFSTGEHERPILLLTTEQHVEPRAPRTTGLFHLAILVNSRENLAHVIGNLIQRGISFSGAGDHLYSEAFYLNDPEGNGIEIYVDRPRSEWTIHENGMIETDTLPVDVQSILNLFNPAREWTGFPAGTTLGHMHLNVSELDERLKDFYLNVLGFDLKTNFHDSALFIAAGQYHHHIALNIWNGNKAPFPNKEQAGLVNFSLQLSSIEELERLEANLQAHHVSYERFEETLIVEDVIRNKMIFFINY